MVCLIVALGLSGCSIGGEYGRAGPGTPQAIPSEVAAAASPFDDNLEISCQVKSASGGRQTIQDFFPWRPPRGSGEENFTASIKEKLKIAKGERKILLGDVNEFIREQLMLAGQRDLVSSLHYFVPPSPYRNGFVAVTALEQIDAHGQRLKGLQAYSNRPEEDPSPNFFARYFTKPALPKGRWRDMVFIVTDDEKIDTNYSEVQVTPDLAGKWAEGCGALPPQITKLELTPRHQIILRVYEIYGTGTDATIVRVGAIPVSQHLATLSLDLGNPQ